MATDNAVKLRVTSDVSQATAGMTTLQARIKSLEGEMSSTANRIKGHWVAASAGIIAAAYAMKQFIDASLQMERINSTMQATMGTMQDAARETQFVREESQRLGLAFQDTALAYAKFAAATKNTSIEGEKARRIFIGVSEAVTALKLTTDEANGIFLALSQMMSKGKISAEELSGQLGERLPGAVKLTAEAMGMTTAELLDMMKKGELMSSDVLPKLAEQLHKTYGQAAIEAASGGQAEINRFNNALFETKAALGDALMPVFVDILNFIKGALPYVQEFVVGIKLMTVDLAAFIDKLDARFVNWLVGGDGDKLKKQLKEINDVADAVKQGIVDKMYPSASSSKSQTEINTENERNAARKAQEDAAKKAEENNKKLADEAKKAAEAYARLVEQAEKFRLSASQEVTLGGLEGLEKELKKNAFEAENARNQFDDLKGAERELTFASIEQVKVMKDRLAIAKEEDKVMEGIKKRLDDELDATNEMLAAQDKLNADYLDLTESLDPLMKAQNEYRRNLELITAWEKQNGTVATEARKKLYEANEVWLLGQAKATLALGDFSDGVTLAFVELAEASRSNAAIMADVVIDAAEDMKASFSDIFFDAMMKDLKSLSDYFNAFFTSIKRSFADALGEMATKWAMFGSQTASSGGLLSFIGGDFSGLGGLSISDITSGASTAWNALSNPASIFDKVSTAWGALSGGMADSIVVFDELGNIINTSVSAFDTLGGVMSSLINPWTIAIAGAGALLATGWSERIAHQKYGYEIDPATVGHMMDASRDDVYGTNAKSWESYMKIKKSAWKTSRRTYRTVAELEDETWDVFEDVYRSVSSSLVKIGEYLKDDIQKIYDYDFGFQEIELTGLSDDEAKAKIEEWAANLSNTAIETLFGTFFKQFQTESETLATAAVRVIAETVYLTDTFDRLNIAFALTGKEAIVASENIIEMAGGFEALQGYMTTYYESFFSDAERQADLTENITTALAEQNMVLPKTREAYRALVESLDVTTESGSAAYVALMALSEAADTYYTYIEQERKEYLSLMTTLQDMKITVMELEGYEDALLLRRAYELEQMDPLLRSTQVRIWQLEEEAEATEKAAAIAKARNSMEIELLTAQGNTTEAVARQRQIELDTLDESLRPLQEMIWAQEDLNVANARAAELLKTRRGMEADILELEGRTVEATVIRRQLELETMDESLWTLQYRIWALQDEAKAVDEAAKAHEDLVKTLKDALSNAESALRDAFGAEKEAVTERYAQKIDALNTKMEKAQDTVATLTDAFSALESARKSMELQLAGVQSANYFTNLKNLPSLMRQVKGGNYAGLTDDVLGSLTDSGNARYYGSAVDYQRDYWKVYNTLSEMEAITGARKSAAEQSVELMQQQIEDLEAFRDKELEALDLQLDAILGVQTSILTLAQAISQYQDAYAALQGAEGGSTGTTTAARTTNITVPYGYSNVKNRHTGSNVINEDVVAELREVKNELKAQRRDTYRFRKVLERWDGDGMPDTRTV